MRTEIALVTVMAVFSHMIVGWSMQPRMKTDLVTDTLHVTLRRRRPKAELLHHSDQGSHYTNDDCQSLVAEHGVQVSMSRTGNCYDNAVMNSFYATLKTEAVDRCHPTRQQSRNCWFDYIELWYNRRRHHSSGITPIRWSGSVSPRRIEDKRRIEH